MSSKHIEENMEELVKKSKKISCAGMWLGIASVVLDVVIILLLLFYGCSGCSGCKCCSSIANYPQNPSSDITWDENASQGGRDPVDTSKVQEDLNKKVEEGMINISMNTSPVFENGQEEGNLLIVNSEVNNYPQVVYIVRQDTGEEIYRSGAIPVGSKIEYAKLSVDLDPGEYNCVAYFNNVDMETGDFLGTAGAEIVITVKG